MRYELPRRTYTLIRVDGKAFHTFTRHCERPFDEDLIKAMNNTALEMLPEMMGAKCAFVQSDEISILLTDFETPQTQAWFDGNLQKVVSISAALATAAFNRNYPKGEGKALFDSRAWVISSPIEVRNYLIWRQKDATRNSINMVAQSLYSHKELHGVKLDQAQELIFQKGINWNDYDSGKKRGRLIVKKDYWITPTGGDLRDTPVRRTRWEVVETPIFTQDREILPSLIPNYPDIADE